MDCEKGATMNGITLDVWDYKRAYELANRLLRNERAAELAVEQALAKITSRKKDTSKPGASEPLLLKAVRQAALRLSLISEDNCSCGGGPCPYVKH